MSFRVKVLCQCKYTHHVSPFANFTFRNSSIFWMAFYPVLSPCRMRRQISTLFKETAVIALWLLEQSKYLLPQRPFSYSLKSPKEKHLRKLLSCFPMTLVKATSLLVMRAENRAVRMCYRRPTTNPFGKRWTQNQLRSVLEASFINILEYASPHLI